MKTVICIDGVYLGFIKPHGNRWKAAPVGKPGKLFSRAVDAAGYVRTQASGDV